MTGEHNLNPYATPIAEPTTVPRETQSLRRFIWIAVSGLQGIVLGVAVFSQMLRQAFYPVDIEVAGVCANILGVVLFSFLIARSSTRLRAVPLAAAVCIFAWLTFTITIHIQAKQLISEAGYILLGGGTVVSLSLGLIVAYFAARSEIPRGEFLK